MSFVSGESEFDSTYVLLIMVGGGWMWLSQTTYLKRIFVLCIVSLGCCCFENIRAVHHRTRPSLSHKQSVISSVRYASAGGQVDRLQKVRLARTGTSPRELLLGGLIGATRSSSLDLVGRELPFMTYIRQAVFSYRVFPYLLRRHKAYIRVYTVLQKFNRNHPSSHTSAGIIKLAVIL